MKRRVVITGCGVLSPIGCSTDAVWDALQARRSGVALIASMPTDTLPVKAGGEVRSFTGHIDDFGPLDAGRQKDHSQGTQGHVPRDPNGGGRSPIGADRRGAGS